MPTTRITERALRDAMRDRRYWNAADPERKDWVDWVTKGWVALENAPPPANGTTREVTVKAYTRRRNGRVEHVDSYTQTRQAANDSDDLVTPVNAGGGNAPQAPQPAPQPSGGRVMVFFVGGLDDEAREIVKGQWRSFNERFPNSSRYFSYKDTKELREAILQQPPGVRVIVVGHSWGADTAAQVVARLGQEGRMVDRLITVDPVGNGLSDNFFQHVGRGVHDWVNVEAGGGSPFEFGNIIGRIGGQYGSGPGRAGARSTVAPYSHGQFRRLLESVPGSGQNGWHLLW